MPQGVAARIKSKDLEVTATHDLGAADVTVVDDHVLVAQFQQASVLYLLLKRPLKKKPVHVAQVPVLELPEAKQNLPMRPNFGNSLGCRLTA